MPDNPHISGVILAGGQGRRLGNVDKARLRLGGQKLLEHAAARLGPQTEAAVVAGGETTLPGLALLKDDGGGPLSGLLAAYTHAGTSAVPPEWLVTAPVDSPFFPTDFVTRALGKAGDATDAVVGSSGDTLYPVCALWRRSALDRLPDHLAHNPDRSVRGFLDILRWLPLDYADRDDNPFFNINRVGDLIRARKHLARNRD
ncbi:molybdenum cofactor guanylyltransferase [Cucumibacter marinus]|uniref:molybdenum cofactor guanylyltransferase n=1 Tax=Cucumibacter marinus TaxID=1121252 RepID=UPI000424C9CF|nr:molybdenum cofactor guanylyltransferase [Cucumibacter marinus]